MVTFFRMIKKFTLSNRQRQQRWWLGWRVESSENNLFNSIPHVSCGLFYPSAHSRAIFPSMNDGIRSATFDFLLLLLYRRQHGRRRRRRRHCQRYCGSRRAASSMEENGRVGRVEQHAPPSHRFVRRNPTPRLLRLIAQWCYKNEEIKR